MKKVILNIMILLFTFNVTLLGSTAIESPSSMDSALESSQATQSIKTVEVSLDSFGTIGIVLMIALSSLLGLFFMKDELSESFKA